MEIHLSPFLWLLLILSGVSIGLAKSGLSGIGIVAIILFAEVFPARESTGMMLLPLIVGDLCSVLLFHQQADWQQLRRVLVPAFAGVILGWLCLSLLTHQNLRPLLGSIILALTALQWIRGQWGEKLIANFHGHWFAWSMGILGGWTTMVANAAGPVMSLFFLAMRLPKFVFVGTSAWFFLGINLIKIPFSFNLGLIHSSSLWLALTLAPIILASAHLGRWLLHRIPQALFENFVLLFALIGGLRMILS